MRWDGTRERDCRPTLALLALWGPSGSSEAATACETALESHRQSLYICRSKDSVNDLEGVLYTTSCGKEGVTEGRDRDYLENKVKLGSSVGGTARPGLVSCAISSRPRLLRLVLSLPRRYTVLGHYMYFITYGTCRPQGSRCSLSTARAAQHGTRRRLRECRFCAKCRHNYAQARASIHPDGHAHCAVHTSPVFDWVFLREHCDEPPCVSPLLFITSCQCRSPH